MKLFRLIKENIYIIVILIIGAFLRFDRLWELMVFIGDQGWFYLSARDLLLTGNVPLVGITSSHTWLHQGPLWTYMLAGALWVSNFNPVSGAVLTSIIGVGSIFLIYKIGEEFFSRELAIIVALLYATSPLIIIHERLAYHTSPIPFLVLVFIYSLIKAMKGRAIYFPFITLSISLLYNFELATVVFIPVVLFFLALGFYKKDKWTKSLKSRKIITLSFLALLIPMIPIMIYDLGHGFPQTIKFGGWLAYKLLGVFGASESNSYSKTIDFFFDKYALLINSGFINIFLLLLSIVVPILIIKREKSLLVSPLGVIYLITIVGILGYLVSGVPSEAYLPMLFPGLILLLGISLDNVVRNKTILIFVISMLSLLNIQTLLVNDYFTKKPYWHSLGERIAASRKILKIVHGRKYNIVARGPGSEFESFTDNYEYLTWWLGKNPPTAQKTDIKIQVTEFEHKIIVKRMVE